MRICDPAWIYICVCVYVCTQRSCMCQSIYTHFVYRVFCTQMSHYDWNEHHRTVTHRPKHIRERTHMSNMTQSLFTIHQYRDIGHVAHRNLLPTRTINVVGSVFLANTNANRNGWWLRFFLTSLLLWISVGVRQYWMIACIQVRVEKLDLELTNSTSIYQRDVGRDDCHLNMARGRVSAAAFTSTNCWYIPACQCEIFSQCTISRYQRSVRHQQVDVVAHSKTDLSFSSMTLKWLTLK